MNETEFNKYSVMMELQAISWQAYAPHHAQKINNALDADDIQEALTTAGAIGDDRLQQQSGGNIVPDAFTHGTSAQRMFWFKKGFETGDLKQGDTFNAPDLN